MSIFTTKKPIPYVSESDWKYRVAEIRTVCEDTKANALQYKYNLRRLRDDTTLTTSYAMRRTDEAFKNRFSEITRRKNEIKSLYEDLQKELECMIEEKNQTEETLELLDLSFKIINHSSSMRDDRSNADYCYDAVSVELLNERLSLEEMKTELMQTCQTAWEQINRLQELLANVDEDLSNKINTLCIDTKLMDMTEDSVNIHFRDPSIVEKDCITYKKWLQMCNNLQLCIEGELVCSETFRKKMYQPRYKTKNYLQTQTDKINYVLRRRIYETNKIKMELEWHKLNIEADRESLREEIEKLEKGLSSKLNHKKLIETRYGERMSRTGPELCMDQTSNRLDEERVQIDKTIRILRTELEHAKGSFNAIVRQANEVVEALQEKAHTLEVERKVLEYRKQLGHSKSALQLR